MVLSSVGAIAFDHANLPAATGPSTAVPAAASGTTAPQSAHGTASPSPDALGASCGAGDSPAPATTEVAAHPASVLYNSQVEPEEVLTGPYAYVAGGAAIRNQGYGEIDLAWPGGTTANLVGAYMIWSIMNDSLPPAWGTINGNNITGTWTAFATPSPCWAPTYIYTFFAEVTPYVLNGENVLTGFPSGVTSGEDPWSIATMPLAEGVSLIAVYDAGTTTTQQVTVYSGAETTEGGSLYEQLNYSTTNSDTATTTYIIADGQLPGNEAIWNGTVIDSDAFPGSDPKETTTPWSAGNLSDTVTFDVPVENGSNNTTAGATATDSDCFTWVGQVLSVGVPSSPGPYPVTFAEQGLADGTEWNVTVNGDEGTGTVVDFASHITIDLTNGTYPYSVMPIPGYTAAYSGSVTVDGGAVYVRIAFHALVYLVNVTESGLPVDNAWWVHLTNASQAFNTNESTGYRAFLSFNVSNGTFDLTDGSTGLYLSDSPSLQVTVAGAPVELTIVFRPPPLYTVTFLAENLTAGTAWGGEVDTDYGDFAISSTTPTTALMLPNASLGYDVVYPASIPGYSVRDYVYFTVDGAPTTVDINYTQLFYVNVTETGLPGTVLWWAYLDGPLVDDSSSTEGTTISFQVANGTYTFSIPAVYAWLVNVSSGSVEVAGSNVTIYIAFSLAPTFAVTFSETGLATGTEWGLTLYLPSGGQQDLSGDASTIVVELPNDTYSYDLGAISHYVGTPLSGSIEVDGAPVDQAFVFAETFTVTFEESGLPTGTYWYLYLNETYNYSYDSLINFTVSNGTSDFTTYDFGAFSPTPSSGVVTVAGANQVVSIVFSSSTTPSYTVEFTESGLPVGSPWTVELEYVDRSSDSLSVNFTEINGDDVYYVYGPDGYTPSPSDGYADVNGQSVSISITFTGTQYAVVFEESGLPDDTAWTVTLAGVPSEESGTDISFEESDGTYDYTVSATGYSADPSSGVVDVDDGAVVVPIDFTAGATATFSVTFEESGLPGGAVWWANISGGAATESSGTSATTTLANGTYDYTFQSENPEYRGGTGELIVDGVAETVPVEFTLVEFSVTFQETGLPADAVWWANVTGGPSLQSDGPTASTSLPNGTYDYTFQSQNREYRGGVGELTVEGAAQTVTVEFSLVEFLVTFVETGLPSGTVWWINITDGPSLQTDGTSVSTSLPNGTFSYTAQSANRSFHASSGHGTVAGEPLTITVGFGIATSSSSPTFLGLPGDGGFVALGGLLAFAALFLLFALTRRRKRKEEETAPPTGAAAPPPPPPA